MLWLLFFLIIIKFIFLIWTYCLIKQFVFYLKTNNSRRRRSSRETDSTLLVLSHLIGLTLSFYWIYSHFVGFTLSFRLRAHSLTFPLCFYFIFHCGARFVCLFRSMIRIKTKSRNTTHVSHIFTQYLRLPSTDMLTQKAYNCYYALLLHLTAGNKNN